MCTYMYIHTYIHMCVCSINFMYSMSSYICTYVSSTYEMFCVCVCVCGVYLHAHVNAYLCTVYSLFLQVEDDQAVMKIYQKHKKQWDASLRDKYRRKQKHMP